MKKLILTVLLITAAALPLFAANGDTDLDMELGFNYDRAVIDGETVNLIGISALPDISVGKFGIGLDASFRFELGTGQLFRFRTEDWVPDFSDDVTFIDKTKTALSLYLPIFRYVRYGWKGDPIYVRLGELDSVTIGTGIFVNEYSNTVLKPGTRLLGGVFDLDGSLFGFPYVGFESFTSDLALLDVISGRLYTRPLAFLNVPIIQNIQIGASAAVDRGADNHVADDSTFTADEMVTMYGGDIMMPLVNSGLFSMTLFGDLAYQSDPAPEPIKALRAGARGRMLGFFDYIADVTFPDEGYIPNYFSEDYDTMREDRYTELRDGPGLSAEDVYLHAGTGVSFLDDNLVFDVSVDGSMKKSTFPSSPVTDPSMTAHLKLGEDIMPFFYFDAYYTKNITDGASFNTFLDQVITPLNDSVITADITVSYKMLVTTIGYTVEYNEAGDSTTSVSVAGSLDLANMLPFLGN